jgi:hypothetical protein
MSEEEKEIVEDAEVTQEEPQAEQAEASEEDSSNPIFDALFKAVDEDPKEEDEEEEKFVPPSSLQSALHEIEQGNIGEQHEQEQPVESEAKQEEVKPKKRVARKKKIVDPDFKEEKFTPPSPPEIPKEDLSSLTEDEKARYDLAKWASKNVDGYRGKEKQYLKFFKDHKQFIEDKLKEDPDIDLTEDETYRQFLGRNRPAFDLNRVKEAKIKSDAEESALQKVLPEIEQQKKELLKVRNEPRAQGQKKSKRALINKSIPKEILDGFRSDKDFTKKYKVESQVVEKVLTDAYALVDAFYDIANDLKDYDPNNAVHVHLSKWIDGEQSAFINSGKTKKQGKTFIRRERMEKVPEHERQNYYTFSDDDLMNILAKRCEVAIGTQIKQTLDNLEQQGFKRDLSALGQKPKEQAVQQPKAISPSPRPGPAVQSSSSEPKDNKILSLLGI